MYDYIIASDEGVGKSEHDDESEGDEEPDAEDEGECKYLSDSPQTLVLDLIIAASSYLDAT